jgi:hypothetical protein
MTLAMMIAATTHATQRSPNEREERVEVSILHLLPNAVLF